LERDWKLDPERNRKYESAHERQIFREKNKRIDPEKAVFTPFGLDKRLSKD
jgi:hypothetical protein